MSKATLPEIGVSDLLPRLKDQGYDSERVARRRAWIEEKTGVSLAHIGSVSFETEELRGNIENPIGAAQVPMGIAGPVLVDGQHAKGLFYVPMATSEGALIRSYERGMVALTRAGGVQTALLADENQIVPTFFFPYLASPPAFSHCMPPPFHHPQPAAHSPTRQRHRGRLTRGVGQPDSRHPPRPRTGCRQRRECRMWHPPFRAAR